MTNEILLTILVFAAFVLLGVGISIYGRYRQERHEIMRRLKQVAAGKEGDEYESRVISSIKKYSMKIMGMLGNSLKPKKSEGISELRRMFLKAGYRRENFAPLFFGAKALFAILFFVAGILGKLWLWKTVTQTNFMVFSIFLASLGFYLPNLWIKIKTVGRRNWIQRGLPDALDLMVVCVEAGTGLDAAINRVAEEMKMSNRALSEEFGLLNLETRAGKQRQEALRNLALRTDLEDISNLVTLLVQTERFGTNIAQALRVHSDAMRTKRYQRAEEIAQKMPIKLIFPLALFILPMFLTIILAPALISLFKHLG